MDWGIRNVATFYYSRNIVLGVPQRVVILHNSFTISEHSFSCLYANHCGKVRPGKSLCELSFFLQMVKFRSSEGNVLPAVCIRLQQSKALNPG